MPEKGRGSSQQTLIREDSDPFLTEKGALFITSIKNGTPFTHLQLNHLISFRWICTK